MMVERVVSSLEMRSAEQLLPAPTGQVKLRSWRGTPNELADVHQEVGSAHRWPSLAWPAIEWRRRLNAEDLRWQVITVGQDIVGVLELQAQCNAQVEITIFGLRPAWQGRGLGGAALTLAARSAWKGFGDPPCTVSRIWLHTSTRDGPRALNNYLRRGFTIFAQQTETEYLPDPTSE